MADVASAVRSFLLNNTGTAITSLTSTRIYPDDLPQGAQLPAIVYNKISTNHEHVTAGGWGLAGFATCRLEMECFSSTRAQANSLADLLKNNIIGSLRGVYGGINFFDATVGAGQRTFVEQPTDASDEKRYVSVVEFLISFYDA